MRRKHPRERLERSRKFTSEGKRSVISDAEKVRSFVFHMLDADFGNAGEIAHKVEMAFIDAVID